MQNIHIHSAEIRNNLHMVNIFAKAGGFMATHNEQKTVRDGEEIISFVVVFCSYFNFCCFPFLFSFFFLFSMFG